MFRSARDAPADDPDFQANPRRYFELYIMNADGSDIQRITDNLYWEAQPDVSPDAPKILQVVKFKPKSRILTDKQERVLWLALKLGFFDYPRKINSIELSRRLGIAPSTLSEMTRRGMRKLLESYFEPG